MTTHTTLAFALVLWTGLALVACGGSRGDDEAPSALGDVPVF